MKTKTVPSSPRRPLHLLIVGLGHASIYLFRSIRKWVAAGHKVSILNDHPFFYYSGMLPEYLGGVYRQEDLRVDLEASCRRVGATLLLGKAGDIDSEEKVVLVSGGGSIACDLAAFDIGSENPSEDASGGAVLTKPLYRLEALEAVTRRARGGRLAIAGGGAAGVEIALNLSARYPDLEMFILEASSRLLPEFPSAAGRIAERLLGERGVQMQTDVRVESASATAIHYESSKLEADIVLWATGTTGQPIFRRAGLKCDDRGFVRVDRTLRSASVPWLFAAGDCAVVEGNEDLRRIGVHAVKQGSILEANVGAVLAQDGGKLTAFRPYPVAPLILSTGTRRGLLAAGRFVAYNQAVLRLKHWADLRWMRAFNIDLDVSGIDLVHGRFAQKL